MMNSLATAYIAGVSSVNKLDLTDLGPTPCRRKSPASGFTGQLTDSVAVLPLKTPTLPQRPSKTSPTEELPLSGNAKKGMTNTVLNCTIEIQILVKNISRVAYSRKGEYVSASLKHYQYGIFISNIPNTTFHMGLYRTTRVGLIELADIHRRNEIFGNIRDELRQTFGDYWE
eukprot:g38554.t1